MTQASNLIIAVSTKTSYLMLFLCLDNWRTGDKLVPTNAGVEGLRKAPRNPLDLLVLTSSHISMQCTREGAAFLLFFPPPPFLFLSSPLSINN